MKLCFLVSVYPRYQNDLEVPWLRKTVNLLIKAGHEITIFAPSFKGIKSHSIDGAKVIRFRYFFKSMETLTGEEGAPNKIHKLHYKIMIPFYFLCGTLSFLWISMRYRFDIIHAHWPAPHALFAFASKLIRSVPIVLTFYTADLVMVKRFPFLKRFLKSAIKHADQVIAISNFTAETVTSICQRFVHVIPYGTTIEVKEYIPTFKANHCILSVGRMIERKGFEYLVRAMPQILKQWPDATLILAGDGPLRSQLEKLAFTLQISKQVQLPGKVSQEVLESYFENCHVFVLPSIVDSKGDTEGLGVVLIEAMTYAKPVVATNIGGITDIVIDQKTGYLVEQKNAHDIATAIHKLFLDDTQAARIGLAGLEHVQITFSWDRVVSELSAVYTLGMQSSN